MNLVLICFTNKSFLTFFQAILLNVKRLKISFLMNLVLNCFPAILVKAQDHPFSISPAVVQSLIQNLHHLNPEFSRSAPELFSRHLVGIRGPMIEEELEAQRIADRVLQEHLRIVGFNTSDPNRKRINPDLDPHQQFLNSSS